MKTFPEVKVFKDMPDIKNQLINILINDLYLDHINVKVIPFSGNGDIFHKKAEAFMVNIRLPYYTLIFFVSNDEDIIIFPFIEANLFKYKDLVNGHKEIKITKNNMVHIYKFIYLMLKIYPLSDVEFEK